MIRPGLHGAAACGAFALVMTAVMGACGNNGPVTLAQPLDASAFTDQFVAGGNVGDVCGVDHSCRLGLACTAGRCAPGHALDVGAPCTISAECKQGDYCGPNRECATAGSGAPGAGCKSDADCASGLRCNLVGLRAECAPEGSVDVGGACASSADCFGGLACASKQCVALPPAPGGGPPLGVSTWTGADCADDPLPAAAYFHVPRGNGDGDFFRLPFPNDARLKNGHPDLSGFPSPGTGLLGFDLVGRYVAAVQSANDGFSTYPTVTLRFNTSVDFDSLKKSKALSWIEFGPSGGQAVGFEWTATTGRNQYVCANSLSARPQPGLPLKPGTTYAFVVSTDVTAAGAAMAVPADLQALLADTAPADAALAASYAAYKPLRDWAAANGGTSKVLDATVFTTGHVSAPAQSVVAAVAAAPAPTVASWTLCNGTNTSPCPQAAGARACGSPDPAFDELHALVTLPIVQAGTEPYLDPAQGGDVSVDGAGNAQVVRTEQVCLALTVPKGTMPAAGWPLVVYAHGTGGSFRSHVTEGVAAMLAGASTSAGIKLPMAVLGIDQVEHGTRRGSSTATPETLFFNFANPGAARGNPLQGAADQAALARLATGLTIDKSVTGAALKFGALAFWGHSQGATAGAIAMPYVKGVGGVVLSGEGASLVDALLTKKNPIDIANVVPAVLEDPGVDLYHPALALLQAAIDPSDPLNHAISLAASPIPGIGAKHVLQPYGLGDTFAPPATESTYAIAARLGVAEASSSVTKADPIGGATPTPVPASGNLSDGTKAITAFVREYQPNGYDGHFVAFKNPDAQTDVAAFLADVVSGAAPKVGR